MRGYLNYSPVQTFNSMDLDTPPKTSWFDKRLIIGALLTIGVALSFWTGSRYPDLQEKSSIGADRELQGIAFDVVMEVEKNDPGWKKVIYTSVNWAATNKKGMAFGLVFAACLLTILGLIDNRRFEGLFANTFKGFLIGAPMGLCVNCAAPVAFGLKKGGARPETALGAMLSSPSMNVIVVGMMFSLLPWYLAALKLLLSLGLVFLIVPLLVKFAPKSWMTPKAEAAESCDLNAVCEFSVTDTTPANWFEALTWTAKTFFKNLWKVGKQTVPLMALAGFLGSILITYLPFEMVKSVSKLGEGAAFVPALIGLAIIGVFLPVPMAFDVVMVVMLMGLGIPVSFSMVLLLTLGSYSIYSYLIVAKAFSQATAIIITGAVVLLGVGGGLLAPKLQQADRHMHRKMLMTHFKNSKPVERNIPTVPAARPWSEIKAAIDASAQRFEAVNSITNQLPENGPVSVSAHDFNPRSNTDGVLFEREPGEEWGFELPTYFSIRKFVIYPQLFVRGMAAGDVHGDNYPDVLVCGDPDIGGLYLYANLGGKTFVRQELDIGHFNQQGILNAALVDLNGDGWLDIVFTSLDEGNFLVINREGQFHKNDVHQLSHKPGCTGIGIGFHDLDRNGWLDMFIGNYSIGHVGENAPISHESSRNQLLYLSGPGRKGSQLVDLPGLPGETQGFIATDFNEDGHPDFMCYNDWVVPDMLYLGGKDGNFKRVGVEEDVVPLTGLTTMSIQSADVDNDLTPEIFISQLTKHDQVEGKYDIRAEMEEYLETAETEEERELIAKFIQNLQVFWNRNVMLTYHFVPEELKQDWIAYHVIRRAATEPQFDPRPTVPEHRTDVRLFLDRIYSPFKVLEDKDLPGQLPQDREEENIFLKRDADGKLRNVAKKFGIHRAGWTWNAAFADLDHDEFQDLYIATGFFQFMWRDNNTFFHNQAGKDFDLKTDEYGLSDYASTSAFNCLDFDRDGDVDIFTLPVTFASVRVFENQGPKGNSVTIQLRDQRGNRFGIGARIVIRYGKDGAKQQMREIRASGGFVSFDPQEAHFGLGDHEEIHDIEVTWYDGRKTRLTGEFNANRCYRIQRDR